MSRAADFSMTELQYRRGQQLDKVHEFHEQASDAYVHGSFAKSTRTLCHLRDYLNSIDLPKTKARKQDEQ